MFSNRFSQGFKETKNSKKMTKMDKKNKKTKIIIRLLIYRSQLRNLIALLPFLVLPLQYR